MVTKKPKQHNNKWKHSVLAAFQNLNKPSTLNEIYKEVRRIRSLSRDSLPRNTDAVIRARIEQYSSDSETYVKKDEDLFQKVSRGVWELREETKTKLAFEAWLATQSLTLKSINNYSSGIRIISNDLSQWKKIPISLFSIEDPTRLKAMNTEYFSHPKADQKNTVGHNMFSRAFTLYIEFRSTVTDIKADIFTPDEKAEIARPVQEAIEGEIVERKFFLRKRNQGVVLACKERDQYACQACNFSYKSKIVEAHHLVPMNHYSKVTTVKTSALITLCPTCHRLAHYLLNKNLSLTNKDLLISKLKEVRASDS